MRKDSPAVYECPKGRQKLHTWKRLPGGLAQCVACKLILNQADAADVFRDAP